MDDIVKQDFEEMLRIENKNLKDAGCELAKASIRIIKNYDGVHRLSLAVSNWFKVLADENNRNQIKKEQEEKNYE